MGMFDGVLLAADFDDTLRSESQRDVPKENLEAIREFTDEGGIFALATGRGRKSYDAIRVMLPPSLAVLSNGSLIYDGIHDTVFWEHPLPERVAEDVRVWMERFPDVAVEIHKDGGPGDGMVRSLRENDAQRLHLGLIREPLIHSEPEELPLPWTTLELIAEPLIGHNDRALAVCQALQAEWGDWYDAAVSGGIVDINAKHTTKASGVQTLAEMLHVRHVFAAGDGYNDLPMLQMAEKGFVPSDGVPAVVQTPGMVVVGPCTRHAIRDVVDWLKAYFA